MKVGYICSDYPKGDDHIPSGISVYTRTVAEALLNSGGHEVHVIESDQWGSAPGSFRDCDGVRVHSVPCGNSAMDWSMAIHEKLLELDLDVVESHNFQYPLIVEEMVGGTPVVVRSASSVFDGLVSGQIDLAYGRRRAWTEHLLESQFVAGADLVLAASEEVGSKAQAVGARAVKVVPLGLPESLFRMESVSASIDMLVSLSRFGDKRKGGDLVDAFLERAAEMGISITVLGELRVTKEQMEWRDKFPNVDFLFEPVSRAELIGLYQRSRMVFVPSRSESFGLSILEPMAVGTPVATFALGESKASWPLLQMGDPSTVTQAAIRSTLKGAEEYYGSKVRDFASRYRIDALIPQYVEAYTLAVCRAAVSGRAKRW